MENKKLFMEEVLRLHDSRNHKVTGSLGVYDAYKYIRKNKWFDIGRPLKEGEFYKIIRGVNNLLAAELIKGNQINLPHRLGTLEIRKRPTRVAIVEGKLVTNLPIDWDATLQLWYEDKEAYNNKTLVRIENEEVFKVYYNKKEANYNNKSFYDFKPNREIKRSLTKSAREGILDAFILKKYD
jgi:hypothetical protein